MTFSWPTFVLQRRINVPVASVEQVLCDPFLIRGGARFDLHADGTFLRLDRPFGVTFPPFGLDGASWTAPATVCTARGRAVVELEVEINVWDPGSTEVVVRPRARRPERWGGRRLRRYFQVAHLTADTLTQFLGAHVTAAPAVPRLTGLTRSAIV